MKKIILLAALAFVVFGFKTEAKDINIDGGYGYFYTSLAPYGSWIELDTGVLVWHPRGVRVGWSPYTEGQWAWTNDGWYWNSYEPFGYIVYHYGRWYYDDYYGWLWVPDDVWGPSWVEWRYNNDYIGWAPLPPYATFSVRLGLHFTFNFVTPYRHWHFIKYRYICEPNVYNHFMGPKYVHGIYIKTKYKADYGYKDGRVINRGVDITHIRNMGGVTIRERTIKTVDNPRQLTSGTVRGNDDVRTYVPSREELSREKVRNMEVIRGERRSSLDISRMNIGKSREANPAQRETIREVTPRNNEPKVRETPPDKKMPEVKRSNTTERSREKIRRPETQKKERVNRGSSSNRKVEKKNEPKRDPRQSGR